MKENLLKKSIYAHCVKIQNDKFIIYHSVFGNPLIVNEDSKRIFDYFAEPKSIANKSSFFVATARFFRRSCHIVPENFEEKYILQKVKENFIEDLRSIKVWNGLSLVVSDYCNFRCPHCLPLETLNMSSFKKMTCSVAKKSIDIFLDKSDHNHDVKQIFFGGREPLTNWPIVKDSIEYASKKSKKVQFALFTNASLVDKDMALFLKKYDVHITSSLDGLEYYNNLHRIAVDGGNAFMMAVNGWKILEENGIPVRNFTCTISSKNYKCLNNDFIKFMKDFNVESIHINIDFTSKNRVLVDDIDKISENLILFIESAEKDGIFVGGQWKRVASNVFHNIFNSINNSFCGPYQGHAISVRPDGSISICSSDGSIFGNIDYLNSMFCDDRYTKEIENRISGFVHGCHGCDIEGFCMGGCSIIDRMHCNGQISKDAMCKFFKKMFIFSINRWALKQ